MNQEIKTKWLFALRSGEYKQGMGALRTMFNEFCCLGVLCDLHSKETGTEWILGGEESNYSYGFDEKSFLPHNVREWAGLEFCDPEIYNDDIRERLSEMNDRGKLGTPFLEIAKAINEYL